MKTWQDIQEKQTVLTSEDNSALKTLAFLVAQRMKLGITQQDFAALIGMKQPQLAKIEQLQSMPSLATLNRYAKGLGLKVTLALTPLEQ
jgi:transcriptional regulator with XRE-family HTH domain